MANLHDYYIKEVRPALIEEFGYQNIMQAPRLEKVTLNMGVGEAVGGRKIMEAATGDMGLIAGQ